MPQPNLYSDQELLEYLRKASQKTDEYVGEKDYRKLKEDSWPAPKTIANRFGSWKEAKKKASLPARGAAWNEEVLTGEEYYKYVKDQLACYNCGESCNAALDFHHPPNSPRKMERGVDISTYAPDRIYEYINGCVVICANCHRKHHYEGSPFNANGLNRLDAPTPEDARNKLI